MTVMPMRTLAILVGGPVPILALALWGGAVAAGGNASQGATIFAQCQACHSPEKGVNRIGPSLFGVVGRPAGSVAGYEYSPAMQTAAKKGLVWTPENITNYLANPHKFLGDFDGDPNARNKMPFFLSDPQQRSDVVAYLETLPGAAH